MCLIYCNEVPLFHNTIPLHKDACFPVWYELNNIIMVEFGLAFITIHKQPVPLLITEEVVTSPLLLQQPKQMLCHKARYISTTMQPHTVYTGCISCYS